jgi:O-antigen/teichoic acid export membrane protein
LNLSQKVKRSLATQQIILSYGLKGASVIISFLYIPVVLGYLDKEKFGVWIALTSVINWIRLFDVGIGNGLRHQLATAIAQGKMEKAQELVSTTYFILGAIFCSVLLIALAINPWLDWQSILNTTAVGQKELFAVTNIALIAIISTFVFQIVKTIYSAHGNTAAGNIMQLISSVLSLFFIWLLTLLTEPGDLVSAVLIVAGIPMVVFLVANLYTYIKRYQELIPKYSCVKIKDSGDLFRLSGKFFVVQITAMIIYMSLPFIITQFYGPSAVSEFHVARSIFNLPTMAIGLFTAPLIPLVTQAFAREELARIRRMLKHSMGLASIISLGTVLMIFLAPWVYKIWLGDLISIPKELTLAIGVYTIITVLVNPLSGFINGTGKVNVLVYLAPVGILIFIAACFIFDYYINSIEAIVWALATTSVVGLIVEPIVLKRYLWR